MATVSKKVVKKKAAPRKVAVRPRPKQEQVELQAPVSRAIPRPLHSPAKVTMRIILEHVYWLGDALRGNDKKRAQREVDELARWARHYYTFASNPSDQKQKYSSNADNYGANPKKGRSAQGDDDINADDEDAVA
jgi:hypothetical protein